MYQITTFSAHQCSGRILVVDQDDWCREFLSQVIKLWALGEFYLASSLEEAQALCEKLSFDLLITDYTMPGMDGVTLARQIRQLFPQTAI